MRGRCGTKEDRYCCNFLLYASQWLSPRQVVTADTSIEVAKDNELFMATLKGMVERKVS